MELLKKVPSIVWALLAPAVIIGGIDLVRPDGVRVVVVGAGPVERMRPGDGVEDRYYYDVEGAGPGSAEALAERVEDAIGLWPRVIVIGLPLVAFANDGETAAIADARDALFRLAQQAENANAVPVVVGYAPDASAPVALREAAREMQPWFRRVLCTVGTRRVCVDALPHADAPDALRAAIDAAVRDALERHEAWRASTQVGR